MGSPVSAWRPALPSRSGSLSLTESTTKSVTRSAPAFLGPTSKRRSSAWRPRPEAARPDWLRCRRPPAPARPARVDTFADASPPDTPTQRRPQSTRLPASLQRSLGVNIRLRLRRPRHLRPVRASPPVALRSGAPSLSEAPSEGAWRSESRQRPTAPVTVGGAARAWPRPRSGSVQGSDSAPSWAWAARRQASPAARSWSSAKGRPSGRGRPSARGPRAPERTRLRRGRAPTAIASCEE